MVLCRGKQASGPAGGAPERRGALAGAGAEGRARRRRQRRRECQPLHHIVPH